MKHFKRLILVSLIGAGILLGGMITQGWEVGGVTWEDMKSRFLPTKQAFEERQDRLLQEAEELTAP